ncbi:Acyl-CoA synthetase (AMP-forming)/AMP-acid ligase II [Nakamurella panacisegetis]|uniref:Acyl-CoA synthetase (AMP-forming)/AMP-acid ligase II n=1 Tax=Nakamurella panacisegetis TaxID=1090615 RepID=A0A1H0LBI7_9ACTN|nr:AMP-binding protein [Nakamurella panacisegetis]SDO65383.1 Acyl-CoA synthetase (AMP-forming)/AMP-acid ligase II [Nakamurella panacisegetis]
MTALTTTKDTLGGLLRQVALSRPDATAIGDGRRRLTFVELDAEVDNAAKALLAQQVRPGDRVGLWLPNCTEWVTVFLAVARLGATLVPVSTAFTADEAADVLTRSKAVLLIAGGELRGRRPAHTAAALSVAGRIEGIRVLIAVHDDVPGALTWPEFTAGGTARDLAEISAAVSPDDPVVILYTSGTTGAPKGVLLPQRMIRNMRDVAGRLQLTTDDVTVLYLPLFHVFALAAVVTFLTAGARVHLLAAFSASGSLELIEAERATLLYGVPAHYYDQLRDPDFDQRDLSGVRLCISPGPAELIREVDRRIATAINCFGSTETTSMITLGDPAAPLDERAGSIGAPLPLSQVRVVGPDGVDVPGGTPGELLVRGPAVMVGYDQDPAATARAVRDGWFHTGDGVQATPSGSSLRFLGRLDEMFKVGGENVDPMEVEAVLMVHPAVGTAAVFGIDDLRLGQVGVAFLTPREPGVPVDTDALRAFARERLAGFKVPRRFVVVTELPTTASGKVQKVKLRQAIPPA